MSLLLGVLDEKVGKEQTDWSTNKIGGRPDWMITENVPICSSCQKNMVMVVQLYCPLEGSSYHRTIYIFTCVHCKNNRWKVIRQQKMDISSMPLETTTKECADKSVDDWGIKTDDWGTEADDWGTDADDWGTDADDWESGETADSKQCSNFVQETTVEEENKTVQSDIHDNKNGLGVNGEKQTEPKPDKDDNLVMDLSSMEIKESDINSEASNVIAENTIIDGHRAENLMSALQQSHDDHVTELSDKDCLLSFYISVFNEPADDDYSIDSKHIKKLLKDYEREQGTIDEQVSSSGGTSSGEKYEKTSHSDKDFHKFSKRISRCHEQVIRYEWNGSPLYISKPDLHLQAVTEECCQNCGSGLVYELQIMPALINSLSFQAIKDNGIEFGTVIIYTCKASCWSETDRYRYEHVFIQADPDQHFFNVANKIQRK